jgi:hypothetical protein
LVSCHSRNFTGIEKISITATDIFKDLMLSAYFNINKVHLNEYKIPKSLLLNLPSYFGFFFHGNFEEAIP